MADSTTYTDLITSEHSDKPNFMATIELDVSPLVQVQNLMESMIPIFDLDLAVGDQLDIIGQWVGISRTVTIPLPDVTFSWDGDADVGWDFGIWQGAVPGTVTVLPDDVYKTMIRAKIAANAWDGTTNGAYAIWDTVFPDIRILIQDNQDMTYDLTILGGQLDSLTLALLTGGYLPLKPEGVLVSTYYIPVGSTTVFGWDTDNGFIQGWDEGAWVKEIVPT